MKLSAPKTVTFIIALILALVGLLAATPILSFIPAVWGLWLLFVGFVLLALGVLLKGLYPKPLLTKTTRRDDELFYFKMLCMLIHPS